MAPDPITLELYRHRYSGISEEMGITLQRTSYSPNIKERLDFSCALFDGSGRLVAQAAHIPAHLGAMPDSVAAALAVFDHWQPGDVVVLNDPYFGGSHLPDITLVSPVFLPETQGEHQGGSVLSGAENEVSHASLVPPLSSPLPFLLISAFARKCVIRTQATRIIPSSSLSRDPFQSVL